MGSLASYEVGVVAWITDEEGLRAVVGWPGLAEQPHMDNFPPACSRMGEETRKNKTKRTHGLRQKKLNK